MQHLTQPLSNVTLQLPGARSIAFVRLNAVAVIQAVVPVVS